MNDSLIKLEMFIYCPQQGKTYKIRNSFQIEPIKGECVSQSIEVLDVKDAPKMNSKIVVTQVVRVK